MVQSTCYLFSSKVEYRHFLTNLWVGGHRKLNGASNSLFHSLCNPWGCFFSHREYKQNTKKQETCNYLVQMICRAALVIPTDMTILKNVSLLSSDSDSWNRFFILILWYAPHSFNTEREKCTVTFSHSHAIWVGGCGKLDVNIVWCRADLLDHLWCVNYSCCRATGVIWFVDLEWENLG